MRKLLLLFASLIFTSHILATSEPFFPIKITNNSIIAGDNEVYVFIKAKLATQSGAQVCAMRFNQAGQGTCQVVDSGTDLSMFNYPLSKLPTSKDNAGHDIYLPQVISGRMYFSIGKPMQLSVNTNPAGVITIPDPDGFKTRDPNYYTFYDKVEFSYTNGGTWINPTAVDFFSIPVAINQPSSTTGIVEAGFSKSSRQQIIDSVKSTFDIAANSNPPTIKDWNHLWLTYQGNFTDGSSGSTILRLMAPGKAMELMNPISQNPPFNPNYLEDKSLGFEYIDALWNFYETHTVRIDASELKNNPQAPKLNNYYFTGKVDENNNFVFTNATQDSKVSFPKPKSISFFAGSQGVFDAANNTPKAIIVRQLTAAFDVGLLPATSAAILDKNYFLTRKGKYYTQNVLLPTQNTGPWYDLYSKALHSIGANQLIYTFAYDDALGQDGTLHDPNANSIGLVSIIIGNMHGAHIPNPTKDNNEYTVNVTLGTNQAQQYYPLTILGKTIQPGKAVIFKNVKAPLTVEFNHKTYQIDFKYPMVRPHTPLTDGIIINTDDEDKVNLIFPGPPDSGVSDSGVSNIDILKS